MESVISSEGVSTIADNHTLKGADMNKVTKGTIAAGAAGVLLLGGASTLALWQDAQTIDAGKVSTGVLDLSLGTAGAWMDISEGAPGTELEGTIVPGDKISYTQPVTITAQGDNLKGEFTIDDASLQDAVGETGLEEVSIDVEPTDLPAGLVAQGDVLSFTDAATYNLKVVITLTFDAADSSSPDTASPVYIGSQNKEIDLTELVLTLDQVRP